MDVLKEINKLCDRLTDPQFDMIKDITELPTEMEVSTITMTCKYDTNFFPQNIKNFINLSENGITTANFGNKDNSIRSIDPKLIQKNNNKTKNNQDILSKKKDNFYNQITLLVNTKSKPRAPINVKIFKNGSLQMTGCISFANYIETLIILNNELNKKMAIVMKENPNEVVEKPFMEADKISISNVTETGLQMINIVLKMEFEIHRERLYHLLHSIDGVMVLFDSSVHAAVRIKLDYKEDDDKIVYISIFVFESGKILIMGSLKKKHIMYAYRFIIGQLYHNYSQIIVDDINTLLEKPKIREELGL